MIDAIIGNPFYLTLLVGGSITLALFLLEQIFNRPNKPMTVEDRLYESLKTSLPDHDEKYINEMFTNIMDAVDYEIRFLDRLKKKKEQVQRRAPRLRRLGIL